MTRSLDVAGVWRLLTELHPVWHVTRTRGGTGRNH